MARLRDFVPAVRKVGIVSFVGHVWTEVLEDDLMTLAAAVAYSWLFAVFPFLIFLLTLAPYAPEARRAQAQQQITKSIQETIPKAGAETLLSSLDSVLNQPRTGLLGIGLVVTLWFASGGVSMTMSALDAAFDAPKVLPFYKQRPLAILLTIILAVFVLLVFVLLPVGDAVLYWLKRTSDFNLHWVWIVNLLRYGLAILLLLAILALLFKFGTVTKQRFSFFSPGAVFTLLVWIMLAAGFRFYVDRFGRYEKMYGAVGGVTIILFYFYLDALVLLIGAEINAEVQNILHPHERPAKKGPALVPSPGTPGEG